MHRVYLGILISLSHGLIWYFKQVFCFSVYHKVVDLARVISSSFPQLKVGTAKYIEESNINAHIEEKKTKKNKKT